DVVLGHARDHAGVAADAGARVDRHPPGVALVLVQVGVVHRDLARRVLAHLRDHFGIFVVLLLRRRADDVALDRRLVGGLLDRPMLLRRGDGYALAGLLGLDPRDDVRGGGAAKGIRVEAGAAPDTADLRAAVAERHAQAALGVAGQHQRRPAHA